LAPQPSATLTIAGSAPTTGAGAIAALAAEARPKAKAALKTSALTMLSSLSKFDAVRVDWVLSPYGRFSRRNTERRMNRAEAAPTMKSACRDR
jgi:hypothetical protein